MPIRFIDPVFSSGVMLAMNSGMRPRTTIHTCRTQPSRARAALKRFDRILRHGPKQFSWFIYRVTNPTMRELFLGPRNVLRMEEALLSMLAGDIFGTHADLGLVCACSRRCTTRYPLPIRGARCKAWRLRAANIRSETRTLTSG